MTRIPLIAGAAILALGLSSEAHAAPIEGGIGFGGDFTSTDANDGGGNLTIDLSEAAYIITNDATTSVKNVAGDLTAIPLNTFVDSYADFNVDGTNLTDPFWQVSFGGTTFSLTLDNINTDFSSENSLVLSGTGTMNGTGFDPTPALWNWTGNRTGSGDLTVQTFSDSSTTDFDPPEVPEPATLGVLSVGLIGLGFAARRRRKS